MPASALSFSSALPKLLGCVLALLLVGCSSGPPELDSATEVTGGESGPGPEEPQRPTVPADRIDGVDGTEAPLDPLDDEAVYARIFQLESLARELSAAMEGGYDTTQELKRKFDDVLRELDWRRAEINTQELDQARLLRLERLKRVPIVVRLPKPAR